jgi:predicted MFS family arabinose efflux permease
MTAATLTSQQKHNFKHLYIDIFWWGVLGGSTISFISLYLTRLSATSFQLGLLSAGPAVVNLCIAMPVGHWLKTHGLVRATFRYSLYFRLGYLALIALPWFLTDSLQVWAILLIYLLAAIPGTILTISFNAMFADLVAPEWRPTVVGRRTALVSLSMTLTSLGCGYLLDHLVFPLNYQLVFAIGVLGGALSSYHLSRLQPVDIIPPRVGRPLSDLARQTGTGSGDVQHKANGLRYLLRAENRDWLRLDLLRGPFALFMLAYLAFYITQNMPMPLFPLYLVNQLGISEGAISVGSALFFTTVMIISLSLNWYTQKFGQKAVLVFGAFAYSLFPLMIAAWPGLGMIWLAHAIGGISWGFAGSASLNQLMDRIPADDRPGHMAIHHITMNIGILAGAFLGPLLGDAIGLQTAIFAIGALRLLAAVLIARWA